MPITSLEPLITFKEIADAKEHLGETKNVGRLFRCLTGLGAFPDSSAKAVATRCIYAPYKEPSEQKREWGEQRFERLRQGKASVTRREAEYFHQAFEYAFSSKWAERTSLKSLIQTPIGELIAQLQKELPLDNADPVQLASMLAEMSSENATKLRIEPDTDRYTRKEGAPSAQPFSELTILKPGDRYFLWADKAPADDNFLVIELADEPLLVEGKEVRAQTMTETVLFADMTYDLDVIEPILTDAVPGRFHYLCLIRPGPWPSLPEIMSGKELQSFLAEIVALQIRNSDISASMLSYRVNG